MSYERHGTRAGAKWHRYHGERPCEPCLAAENLYRRNRKRATKTGSVPHGFGGAMSGCKCTDCLPWTPVRHGTRSAYANGDCRCEACARAQSDYNNAWGKTRQGKAAQARQFQRTNAESLESAYRYGQPWRVPELEVAARTDIAMREAALMLGRTYAAVMWARRMMRADPRVIERGMTSGKRP